MESIKLKANQIRFQNILNLVPVLPFSGEISISWKGFTDMVPMETLSLMESEELRGNLRKITS